MTDYNLVIRNPVGETVQMISNPLMIDCVRSANTVGKAVFQFTESPLQFGRDYRVELWRRAEHGSSFYLEGQTFWLVRSISRTFQPGGRWVTQYTCADTLDLLNRRIVDYLPETLYADKLITEGNADYEDNLMKAFVRENLGTLAVDTDRTLSLLAIEEDKSQGATEEAEKQASMRQVIGVLQELAQHSSEAGTDLFFDIEATPDGDLTFRTYANYRGIDRTNSLSFGAYDLGDVEVVWDYSQEVTAVTVGGYGQGSGNGQAAGRAVERVTDDDRIAMSPFNRIEDFVDARDWEAPAILQSEGRVRLHRGAPRISMTGRILDTRERQYGLHYFYGDYVKATVDGIEFSCHIDAVNIRYEDRQEDLDIRLRGEILLASQPKAVSIDG